MKIETGAPSAMHRDLGAKFMIDLQKLILRSADLMVEELGENYAANIVLSCLASAGLRVARECQAPEGTFQLMVRTIDKYMANEESRKQRT